MQWTDNQVQGIMSTYNHANSKPVFYVEYLDWKRNPSAENLELLYQLYKLRYANLPIDMIMTTDDAALEFALRYRQELFSDAPVVFSGVFPQSAARMIRGQRRVTGVQEQMDINGTLEIMKTFQPGIRQVYLIYDNTESGQAAQDLLERAIGNLNPAVVAIPLNTFSYQEIVYTLQNAPPDSAVLMATYSHDSNGVVKDLEWYTQLFSGASRVPVYVLYDFEIGWGAVGGSVISGFLQGKTAADMGLRILNGEEPSIISPAGDLNNVATLDYEQIKRFRLPEDKIPPGSIVINRPPSFYAEYKQGIWIACAVFSFLVITIIVLTINIRRKKAAERELKHSNEELNALYEEVLASQEELQAQYKKLDFLAYHDPLTGLWNRTALQEQLNSLSQENNGCGTVLFIDIDNFKFINDTFGHQFGDTLLESISKTIRETVRHEGFVARMGGDEFVIILYHIIDREQAAGYAEEFRTKLMTPLQIDGNTLNITFSIGLTIFPEDGANAERLLKNADLAMYQAKEQGKNRYVFYNRSLEAVLHEKLWLEQHLRVAIDQGELQLWYQPFVQVKTGRIIGFEALLRWHCPGQGVIGPLQFIGSAEKNGLILPIGLMVLRSACSLIASLQQEGYTDLLVTVNISVVQLAEDNFVQSVADILAETGARPGSLGLEITESVFMEHSQESISKLLQLKSMGITTLLDDFGSGYSSLNYLTSLPIDAVKIDKTFIQQLDEPGNKKPLAGIIIDLAHQINAYVVAEGVESESQLRQLANYQCEVAQGYFFSKPVPADGVWKLLRDTTCSVCWESLFPGRSENPRY